MALADYAGRLVDLSLYHNVPTVEGVEQLLDPSFIGDGRGTIVTGIQKLAQRFVRRLLTITGSGLYDPDEGCEFLSDAVRGSWRSEADVFLSFSIAKEKLSDQFALERADTDPADEVFDTAELLSVTINDVNVSLRIQVTSAAGESRTIISPLPVVI